MAFVDIHPQNRDAENEMTRRITEIRAMLRNAIANVFGVLEHDIIVQGHYVTVVRHDVIAEQHGALPDLVIKINTSDKDLKANANDLRDAIVAAWKGLFPDLKLEVWIGFFECWGCTIDFSEPAEKEI